MDTLLSILSQSQLFSSAATNDAGAIVISRALDISNAPSLESMAIPRDRPLFQNGSLTELHSEDGRTLRFGDWQEVSVLSSLTAFLTLIYPPLTLPST
jgi:hypothetical protein